MPDGGGFFLGGPPPPPRRGLAAGLFVWVTLTGAWASYSLSGRPWLDALAGGLGAAVLVLVGWLARGAADRRP